MWRLTVQHYDEASQTPDHPIAEYDFSFDTEAECVAAQDMLKYITRWNGGEPIVSSTYKQYEP